MKKQIVVALAFLITTLSFAQKDELKAAEKAIKSGNFADAKTAINSAESLINSADNKTKAKFYFLKGQALYANGTGSIEDQEKAIESFKTLKEIETADGKIKYSDDASEIKQAMLNNFLTKANSALESKNYMVSSANFEKAYRLSPKDTLYLFYAASTAVTSQDFDTSLKYYEELRDLGYQGEEIIYEATNKATGEVEAFPNKALRDVSLRSGTHVAAKDNKSGSKSAEIIKNIALIYVNKGENEKAISAMKEARKENPDDLNLILNEANVQIKMGNKEEFKKLINLALEKDPNNAELLFNLGIVAADSGEKEAARSYYEKALKINPDYPEVYNNMAVLVLSEESEIVEQMNSLGSSAADNKKYDELKEKRNDMYKKAIPYLESTLRLKPDSVQAAETLMNIYSAMGETEKFKAMKAKVAELKGN